MICFHNNDFVLITEWPGIWTLQTHVYTVVLWHRCIQCMHVKSLTTCDLGAFIGYDMSTQIKLWTWETKAIPMARPTAISRESKKKSLNLYNLPSWRSLDLLWEYRIQHGANGPLYVTSNYSTWIFCRGVSGFATDCPCGVWCRGSITCLLHVGPPFENRILNNSWAVGLT